MENLFDMSLCFVVTMSMTCVHEHLHEFEVFKSFLHINTYTVGTRLPGRSKNSKILGWHKNPLKCL